MTVKSKGGSAALKRDHQARSPETYFHWAGTAFTSRRKGKKKTVGQGRG
jgi:hypothetical protein